MPLNIIVCIKAVVASAPRGRIVRSSDNSRFNPFDLPALEAALQIRTRCGGSVTALSMGPPSSRAALSEALAMGADRGVLACDTALAGADTLATSETLAAAVKKMAPFDLLLFGTRTADSDTGQVGPQTAVILGIPMVTGVHRLSFTDEGLQVVRTMDHLEESFSVAFPAALTIRPEASVPRDLPLSGLAEAFDHGGVDILTLGDLGVSSDRVGEAGSPTRVLSMKPVTHDRSCRMISGAPSEAADQLLSLLVAGGLLD